MPLNERKLILEGPIFHDYLCGGFKYFLVSSLFGEGSYFDYFSDGLVQPPTSYGRKGKQTIFSAVHHASPGLPPG